MPTVVITNACFDETKALLAPRCTLVCNDDPDRIWSRAQVIERLQGADAMLAFMTDSVDEDFLAACPTLRIIACALKGYDNFDTAACRRRGVALTFVQDLLTVPTAELAIGLTLAVTRHIPAADRSIRTHGFHGWRPTFYGTGIAASTVGIVGFGAVGRAIAERLHGFGARLLAVDGTTVDATLADRYRVTPTPMASLLADSDIVILALPLTADTLHMIDADAIASMKPGAYLVNPGRGSVVDEHAVAAALASGHLAGYAADVFEMEDWARADRPPRIHEDLISARGKTVLTPHIGSAVTDVRKAIEREAALSILNHFDTVPPGPPD